MGSTLRIESGSHDDTARLAFRIAQVSSPGDIYALTGELGSGKTVFAKGFAQGFGVLENVTSPTFNLMNVYSGRLPFFHFDLYRLDDAARSLEGIGYEDYFFADGVSLVEWADRAASLFPPNAVWVGIERPNPSFDNGGKRIITLQNFSGTLD